ncbi:MAG: FkbM family methyltransferase [Candidatus Methylomirabilia bacterium]
MITRFTNAIRSRLRRKSFALNELDLKLRPYLDHRGGFFVEAGANDGVNQSNTLYFEKYLGWRGLLIEAIPALAERCRRNRPKCQVENCALVASGYPGTTVEMRYCNLMSFMKGSFGSDQEDDRRLECGRRFLGGGENSYTLTVPAKTLAQVLVSRGIERIDFMSLDVEGAEIEVLQGIDFDAVSPALLLVEVRHEKVERINALLRPCYDQVQVLDSNDAYADVLYRAR